MKHNDLQAEIHDPDLLVALGCVPGNIYWKDSTGKYLGCNSTFAINIGLEKTQSIKGLTDLDMPWKQDAMVRRAQDMEIMKTGAFMTVEESIEINSQQFIWLTRKELLRNSSGEIIGVICNSLDITKHKDSEQKIQKVTTNTLLKQVKAKAEQDIKKLKDYFENILAVVPGHVYWKNLQGEFLGCNSLQADDAGFSSRDDILGLTDYDMPWKEDADFLRNIDAQVINSGLPVIIEEKSKTIAGKQAVWLSHKKPLKNRQGQIIGIVGTSIDITAQKEAERLKLENETNKASALEFQNKAFRRQADMQNKFRDIVDKANHDMRSPLMALQLIFGHYASLFPEEVRNDWNYAVTRLLDIANDMLNYYDVANAEVLEQRTILAVPELLSILSEKRYEYSKQAVKFTSHIAPGHHFTFLHIDVIPIILNNLSDKYGKIPP